MQGAKARRQDMGLRTGDCQESPGRQRNRAGGQAGRTLAEDRQRQAAAQGIAKAGLPQMRYSRNIRRGCKSWTVCLCGS